MTATTTTTRRARPRTWRLAASIAALVIVSAACNPVFGRTSGPVQHETLSRYSDSEYHYVAGDGDITVIGGAPFSDSNVREVFWSTDDPFVADQQTCMTWETTGSGAAGVVQPGIAMRIASNGPDHAGIKAISIDENVWAGAVWVVQVLGWTTDGTDSQDARDHTKTSLGSFDLSSVVGHMWRDDDGVLFSNLVPPPWHVCARTQGSLLSFKVWTGTNLEPSWHDATHVFTTSLPDGWNYPGYSGGYIAHLGENRTATFSGFSTIPLCLAPGMAETDHCRALLPTTTTSTTPDTTTPDTTTPEPTTPDTTTPDTTTPEPTTPPS